MSAVGPFSVVTLGGEVVLWTHDPALVVDLLAAFRAQYPAEVFTVYDEQKTEGGDCEVEARLAYLVGLGRVHYRVGALSPIVCRFESDSTTWTSAPHLVTCPACRVAARIRQ